MSDTYVAGKNKKKVKNHQKFLIFFGLLAVFLIFLRTRGRKKIKKKYFKLFFTLFNCFNRNYCTINEFSALSRFLESKIRIGH
jgi:hypothetical protein